MTNQKKEVNQMYEKEVINRVTARKANLKQFTVMGAIGGLGKAVFMKGERMHNLFILFQAFLKLSAGFCVTFTAGFICLIVREFYQSIKIRKGFKYEI